MPEKTATKGAEQKEWIEIILYSPPQLIEALSNFLTDNGAKGVFQESVLDDSAPEGVEEDSEFENLKAYIAAGPASEKKLAALGKYIASLADLFPDLKKPTFKTQQLADANWGEQWKKYFKPLRLTKNIVIKPTWERYTPQHRDIVVEIDPGMAFGTGQHPSTRMCLESIEDILLKDRTIRNWRVLDVGTGTGILGISCAKLGAESVVAVDIDAKAVEIARKNVVINGVEKRVQVLNRDVRKMKGAFDLIVANLTAETLLKIKDNLLTLMDPGRYLVISGIIAQNGTKIEEAFFTGDLISQSTLREKEWVCHVLKKRDRV